MQRRWRALLAVGALVLLAGCPAPARRGPGDTTPGARTGNLRDLNGDVARIAAAQSGAGRTAAVVLGNMALLATNLDRPGAVAAPGPTVDAGPGRNPTGGGASTRTTETGTTSAPGAAGHSAQPGGQPGMTAARPGGGHSPGPVAPGGSPTSVTQDPTGVTAPPGMGGPNVAPPHSGQGNLWNDVATAIRQEFPFVTDVRFVVDPAQAAQLAAIQTEMANGTSAARHLPVLTHMALNAQVAMGMTPMPGGTPNPGYQPQGGPAAPGGAAPGLEAPGGLPPGARGGAPPAAGGSGGTAPPPAVTNSPVAPHGPTIAPGGEPRPQGDPSR